MINPAKIANFVFLPHFYLKILAFTFFYTIFAEKSLKQLNNSISLPKRKN